MDRGDPGARGDHRRGLSTTTGPTPSPRRCGCWRCPPTLDGAWGWSDLVDAVRDALDSAKMRAIEPVHVDTTAYSAFLPATHSAWTYPEISISNNLLRNVRIYSRLTLED